MTPRRIALQTIAACVVMLAMLIGITASPALALPPVIQTSISSGSTGTEFTISGSGFQPNERIQCGFDTVSHASSFSGTAFLGDVVADAFGFFFLATAVPSTLEQPYTQPVGPGTDYVVDCNGAMKAFEVTPAFSIDVLPLTLDEFLQTYPIGINGFGSLYGSVATGTTQQPFFFLAGQPQLTLIPNPPGSTFVALNDVYDNLAAGAEGKPKGVSPTFCTTTGPPSTSCENPVALPTLGGGSAYSNAVTKTAKGIVEVAGQSQITGDARTDPFFCTLDKAMTACTTKPVDLGNFGGSFSGVVAMNSSSVVVGSSNLSGNKSNHAFACNATPAGCKLDDLGTLGGTDSAANSVNSGGLVVGYATLANGNTRAVSCQFQSTGVCTRSQAPTSPKGWMNLGTLPGDTSSAASAVNDFGVIGGDSASAGSSRAVIWSQGQIFNLNKSIPPKSGWVLSSVSGVNDLDEITGTGTLHGKFSQFVLTPTSKAGPVIRAVGILPKGFSPPSVKLVPGGAAEWLNEATAPESLSDPLGLVDSASLGLGGGYLATFFSAGTFSYTSSDKQKGQVDVAVLAAPATGTTKTTFQLVWAGEPAPKGYQYEVSVKTPGSTAFKALPASEAKAGSGSYLPRAGAGTYVFEARLANPHGKVSGYSTITVRVT